MKKLMHVVTMLFLVVSCTFSNLEKVEQYYPDGSLKATGFKDKSGKYQDDFITYYEDGSVKSMGRYKDGKLNGRVIKYEKNVKIVMKFSYGVRIDTTFLYDKKSEKLEVYTVFDKGKKTQDVFFYPNGNIQYIITYFVGIELSTAVKTYTEKGILKFDDSKLMILEDIGDSIQFTPFGLEYNEFDSAQIMVLKNFNYYATPLTGKVYPDIIRTTSYPGKKQVKLKLLPSDYIGETANVRILFWYEDRITKVCCKAKEFCVQLKKGEKLPKDNVRPIYFEE